MTELLGLLGASFLASTVVPLPSEAALYAYLQARPDRLALAVGVATLGNTAGGMTSYLVGRLIPQKQPNARALGWLHRYGAPATFFAFLPLVGDALCVGAGWLRIRWPAALAFMAAGRLARYIAVALLFS
jgi:membrane protein YqaA with SNARE-associated domain